MLHYYRKTKLILVGTLLILVFTTALISISPSVAQQITETSAASSTTLNIDDPLCDGSRITFLNFPMRYSALVRKLSESASNSNQSVLNWIHSKAVATPEEECAWNHFIFLDFAIYFQKISAITPSSEGGALSQAQVRETLLLRDQLLDQWLSLVPAGSSVEGMEWGGSNTKSDTKNESFDQYLKKGSQKYKVFQAVGKILHPDSKIILDSVKNPAAAALEMLTLPKTPFSSIMPKEAFYWSAKKEMQSALACIRKSLATKIEHESCDENLFDLAARCANKKEEVALAALGVFSSQRLYVLRDFKTYFEQHFSGAELSDRYQALVDGTSIYFKMETYAQKCGLKSALPTSLSFAPDLKTLKAYHFYSQAYLATRMKIQHVDFNDSLNSALAMGKQYKKFTGMAAQVYNIILGNHRLQGAAGDQSEALELQKQGFTFGWNIVFP